MVMLATATQVHTTGINIAAVLSIVLPVVGAILGVGTFLDNRTKRREERRDKFVEQIQQETQKEITTAVNHLSEVLLERLETKQAVNDLRVTIAGMQAELRDMRSGQRT